MAIAVLKPAAHMFFVKLASPSQPARRAPTSRILLRWLPCLILLTRNFTATATDPSSVRLTWNPSPDANVVGYRIYYGGASAHYTNQIAAGNLTTALISGLGSGKTYYFATTAYTADGVESPFSNEIRYTPNYSQLRCRATETNQMTLTITGEIGHRYEIEATQDLANWTVIGAATVPPTGSTDFTDPNAGSFTRRFYRLRDTTP